MDLISFGSSTLIVNGKGYTCQNETTYVPQLHAKWCNSQSFNNCNCGHALKSPALPLIASNTSSNSKTNMLNANTKLCNEDHDHSKLKINNLNLNLQ